MMQPACWDIWPDRGFLLNPDPLRHLAVVANPLADTAIAHIEDIAADLPSLIKSGKARPALDDLPVYPLDALAAENVDPRVVERLILLYAYFANAYVHTDQPTQSLPSGVAVPLSQLSALVDRPPILSYVTLVLSNWRRLDDDEPLTIENMTTLQTFLDLPDERWFALVHVTIEARAASILQGIHDAIDAANDDDPLAFQRALRAIHLGIVDIVKLFHQMPKGCDPDVYFHAIRPFMFGFNNVVFEGVGTNGGRPQNLRGGSGAQSSIVPALVAALDIRHQQSSLTVQLEAMKAYMPAPHRRFIAQLATSPIRAYVEHKPYLADAYNQCLRELITFRRAHFYYARTYIFEKSTNPVGTGGTTFMDFLIELVEETRSQLL